VRAKLESVAATDAGQSRHDEMLAGASTEEIAGTDGLLVQPTKRLIERAMEAELTDQLG
jgi:hypothetical protein